MYLFEAIQKFAEYRKFVVQKNTTNSYSFILRSFCLHLKNPQLEEVTLEDIFSYFQLMDSLGWDSSSLTIKGTVLKQFFGYFEKRGLKVLNSQLIPIPQRSKKMPRVGSEEKYRTLLEVIPPKSPMHERNKALLMLYHDTGCRNSEILSLNLSDINTITRSAIVRTEKAKKLPFREIYWSEETNEQIKKWIEIRKKFVEKENDVFFICMSSKHLGIRLGKRGVVKLMKEYSEKAGLETVNVHQWRHLFGVSYAKSGANNSAISSLMGHSSIQSSQVYTTLYGEDLKEVWGKYRKT